MDEHLEQKPKMMELTSSIIWDSQDLFYREDSQNEPTFTFNEHKGIYYTWTCTPLSTTEPDPSIDNEYKLYSRGAHFFAFVGEELLIEVHYGGEILYKDSKCNYITKTQATKMEEQFDDEKKGQETVESHPQFYPGPEEGDSEYYEYSPSVGLYFGPNCAWYTEKEAAAKVVREDEFGIGDRATENVTMHITPKETWAYQTNKKGLWVDAQNCQLWVEDEMNLVGKDSNMLRI